MVQIRVLQMVQVTVIRTSRYEAGGTGRSGLHNTTTGRLAEQLAPCTVLQSLRFLDIRLWQFTSLQEATPDSECCQR